MQEIKLHHGFTPSDFSEAKEVYLTKGELFLYEGDKHKDNCFLILNGKLDVRLISGSGHETLLYHLQPGELVGELAMFGVTTRTATVIASESTKLLEVSAKEFAKLIKNYDFLQKVTSLFIERYIRTHDVVCRLGQPNIGMKLCRYFMSLSDQYAREDDQVQLRLPSHSEMGQLLSCQRETVTREMKKLIYSGVVIPNEGGLFLLNRTKTELFLADMLD